MAYGSSLLFSEVDQQGSSVIKRLLIPKGALVEVTAQKGAASARYTLLAELLREAQSEGELCAFIERTHGNFFPPDFDAQGVDLGALSWVRLPRHDSFAICKAAELLLRSGGFGLLVLDFSCDEQLPSGNAWAAKLLGLAREHDAQVILVTGASPYEQSVHSTRNFSETQAGGLVHLRLCPVIDQTDASKVIIETLKNKSGAAVKGEIHCELPLGLQQHRVRVL